MQNKNKSHLKVAKIDDFNELNSFYAQIYWQTRKLAFQL